MNIILKTLVGSRAHGLHNEDSDYDYRGVYVEPTEKILSLGYKYKGTHWLEGHGQDETAYEIGHFLQLCTKANPSVLEVLLGGQRKVDTPVAEEMRSLFPYMYNPKDAFNAFCGYAKNQQKKLLDNHLDRRNKFAVSYIRTAMNLYELFKTGSFTLEVFEGKKDLLRAIKYQGDEFTNGEILDIAETYIQESKKLLPEVENKQNIKKINDFLIRVRKDNLSIQ